MKIKEYFVDIAGLIDNIDDYEAHINCNQRESLMAHINLSNEYFENICYDKGIDRIIEKASKNLFQSEDNSINNIDRKFFKKLVYNIVNFHDIGKINPIFQRDKMKNTKFKNVYIDELNNANHSQLSAIIYIDYFLNELNCLNSDVQIEKRDLLKCFVFIFGYIISRHHSNLTDIKEFIEKFNENDPELKDGYLFFKYLKNNEDENELPFFSYRQYKNIFINLKNNIDIFTISRLLFSLLVTSDYYATSEFMSGIKMKDYGNIKDFTTIYNKYKEGEIYKLIEEYKKNKEKIQEDINSLRSELFIESENELLKNKDKKIFFLEAPTGSYVIIMIDAIDVIGTRFLKNLSNNSCLAYRY